MDLYLIQNLLCVQKFYQIKSHFHFYCLPPHTLNQPLQELNLLTGTFNKERGLISYTFPADERFTPAAIQRCRIEATIPPTAVLELTDAGGTALGHGFEGFYDLRNKTLYFRITAADGTVKSYQLTCKYTQ